MLTAKQCFQKRMPMRTPDEIEFPLINSPVRMFAPKIQETSITEKAQNAREKFEHTVKKLSQHLGFFSKTAVFNPILNIISIIGQGAEISTVPGN